MSWRMSRTFLGSAISIVEARRFVAAFLRAWPNVEDAVLIVSELSTNAVRHSNSGRPGGRFLVTLDVEGSVMRLAVLDEGGPRSPHLLPPSPTELGGRGLALVSDLSAKWGVSGDDGGRSVWAILEAAPILAVRR